MYYYNTGSRKKKRFKNLKPSHLLVVLSIVIFLTYILLFESVVFNNVSKIGEIDKQPEKVKNVSTTVNRVTPGTDFLFKYIYTEDDNVIEKKEKPSYYEINMTEDEIKEKYKGWTVISFSPEEVVFEKKHDGMAPDYYVISEKDGFMAVFYENPDLGLRLREVTTRPLDSLPEEEQQKIREGIIVYGEANLIKVLEDYDS